MQKGLKFFASTKIHGVQRFPSPKTRIKTFSRTLGSGKRFQTKIGVSVAAGRAANGIGALRLQVSPGLA